MISLVNDTPIVAYIHTGQIMSAVQVATVNISNLVDPYIANGSINNAATFDGD